MSFRTDPRPVDAEPAASSERPEAAPSTQPIPVGRPLLSGRTLPRLRLSPKFPTSLTAPRLVALAALNVMVLADLRVPVLRPVLAVWLLLLAPTRLVAAKVRWQARGTELFVLAFAVTLVGAILGGLALNTLLPLIGVSRPLDPVPTVLAADAALVALTLWRSDTTPAPLTLPRLSREGLRVPWPLIDVLVVAAAALGVLLCATGPIRLNNGAGGGFTAAGLVVVVGVFVVSMVARHRLRERSLHLMIYLQSLSLLVMTSLRGWYTTGHDIQREYQVLELAAEAGRWNVGIFRDAYNACLSITILPTMITGVTGSPLVEAFKVYNQLIFALTPVVVYLIARRWTSTGLSLLGVVFFVAFPTFFTDMPFLNRQEVAFLFLAASVLAISLTEMTVAHRRLLFAVLSTGTVLSHYSTTYILIGVVVLAGLLRAMILLWNRVRPAQLPWLDRVHRISLPAGQSRPRPIRLVVGWGNIVVLIGTAFLWSNAITHTDAQIGLTVGQTAREILAPGSAEARSSDVTYNIFSSQHFDPVKRLADYRADTIRQTAAERATGQYLPLSVVDRFPVQVVQSQPLPLTPVGVALRTVHINAGSLNGVLRASAARLLQIFVFVGLLVAALMLPSVRRRFRPSSEVVLLGMASFAVVVSQVLLPGVSVNYGVLRAFQQSLILLAPFLAVGAVVCLRWLRSWADRATAALAVGFLASLTGLLPQLTGGYPPQLHLNNAGPVYDVYYAHEQDLAAADWLSGNIPVRLGQVQYQIETHRFASYPLTALNAAGPTVDIFPTLIRDDSVVLLDYTAVTQRRAVISVSGDQITCTYPLLMLQQNRNLVYDNGGAQVYR
jgi:uncharacterized membrane protein